MGYLVFILPALILSIYAQYKVKATFEKYSRIRSRRGLTGRDIAAKILSQNNLGGILIEPVAGSLSDHYDPRGNVVRLSESVYASNSIAAMGVAAHESGHAIQHGQKYGLLELRHSIVPVANFASGTSFWILMAGFLLRSSSLVMVGIVLFSLVVLFHIVTLPVELNASRRAVVELGRAGVIANEEIPMVKQVLGAAALTYLAATLSAVMNLLYYIMIFTGGDDN